MKSLLAGMKYTPSAATDIRKTFERIDPEWNRPPHKRRAKRGRAAATVMRFDRKAAK